ncbi:DUF4382 domain-containing protein [Robiginitalea sp. SC105]|uniref:DUF4382 domain-containing protein n=1 Tax=Robiginitalea sp. SC105 TaxID=2762332 RepID=UPI00163A36F7|nr:DUF4382 domain-containing protein [Robiginitalea sp. SC105]MBC2840553.1 DUF4382 domain-containing protein [Robiginitalea sp. SC105]
MKRKLNGFLAFAAALLLLATGCSDENDRMAGEGHLNVYLTDAPFPYDLVSEVNVTITKIDARLADEGDGMDEMEDSMEGTEESDPESDTPENQGGFITLMETETDLNLLTLTNGNLELLADIDIPAGAYDLVRVHVQGISVVLKDDGGTFDLKVPSGSQTGIKVFIEPSLVVAGGLSTDLLLDFDVSRSFVAKGGNTLESITGFNFKPVIKASNMSVAGTISGFVTELSDAEEAPVLEDVQISIIAPDGTVVTTTATNPEGAYAVMGLDAGTYTVLAELDGYEAAEASEVTVVAGNRTSVNFELVAIPAEN